MSLRRGLILVIAFSALLGAVAASSRGGRPALPRGPSDGPAFLLTARDGRYTLEADGAPLSDILRAISEAARVPIHLDSDVNAAVTARVDEVLLEDLLELLAQSHALIYERTPEGLRLVSAHVTSQESAPPPAVPRPTRSPEEAAWVQARGILTNTEEPASELRRHGRRALLLRNAWLDTRRVAEEGRWAEPPPDLRADARTEFFIVQFDHPLTGREADLLARVRGSVSHYVPNSALAVHLPPEKLEEARALPGVEHIEPYHPYFKANPEVLAHLTGRADEAARQAEEGQFRVLSFRGVEVSPDLQRLGIKVLQRSSRRGFERVTVACPPDRLRDLVRLENVQWIEPVVPAQPLNDLGARTLRVPLLRTRHPTLQGNGVTVAVVDTGVDPNHPAFAVNPALPTGTGTNTRIVYYAARPSPTSDGLIGDTVGHGTHVAGSILGNGALSETVVKAPGSGPGPYPPGAFAGIAPAARLVMLEDFNSFTNAEQARISYQQGARIQNNSWGAQTFDYDSVSAEWDELVRDADPDAPGNQEYIVFFAAGNSGGGDRAGRGGEPHTICSPAHAKNVIAVGALEQARFASNLPARASIQESDGDWQVAWFSSRGPVSAGDRRVKPDLVAPGSYVLSAQSKDTNPDLVEEPPLPERDYRHGNVDSGTNYAFLSGTSMATPLAAGAAALLYEYFTNAWGGPPSPAMVKAILVNSARMVNQAIYPMPGRQTEDGYSYAWPDVIDQGWGALDIARALDGTRLQASDDIRWLDQNAVNPLATDGTYTYQYTVNPGDGGLKITLAWTDPAGSPGNACPLVNDLDLTVLAPDGGGYVGNLFGPDGVASYRVNDPTNTVYGDAFNNVEVVFIPEPAPGTYTIRVHAYEVPEGPQDFALAIEKGLNALPPHSGGDYPAMALSANGAPVVAYSAYDRGGQKQIYVKKWVGPSGHTLEIGSWKRLDLQWYDLAESARKTGISKTFEDSFAPAVAVSGERIYVAWQEAPQTPGPSHILFRMWDGTNWVELAGSGHNHGVSGDHTYSATDPMVGTAWDGQPLVAWRQPFLVGVSDYSERIRVVKWNGTNWVGLAGSDTNGIPGTGRMTSNPVMVMDLSGFPVIAWEDGIDRVIKIRRWNGSAWQDLGSQGLSPLATDPSLAVGPDNTLYLAWLQTPSGSQRPTYEVFASRYVAGSWQEFGGSATYPVVRRTTNSVVRPFQPGIAVAPNGHVFVAWQLGNENDPNAIYLRRWNGTAWEGVQGSDEFPGVARSGGIASNLVLLVDRYGQPVLTYESRVSGACHVFTYRIVSDENPPEFGGLRSATGGTNQNVFLAWDAASDTSTTIYYHIYRSTQSWTCGETPACSAADVFSHRIATVTNELSFQVTGLANDRLYCFGVRAEDTNGLMDANTVMKTAGPIFGAGDPDGDCLPNNLEFAAGTEACLRDTDGDEMWDGWEWTYATNNPAHAPGLALDPLDNGQDNLRTLAPDDGDESQGPQADLDGDGASNREEFQWWYQNVFLVSGCDAAGPTQRTGPDPTDADTDGDGMGDGWEIFNDLNPADPSDAALDLDGDGVNNATEASYGTDPRNPDSDGDGLTDADEILTHFTDPTLADTDQDGLDDGFELAVGSDPRDADTNDSFLSDGDTFQLGWDAPAAAITNFNFLLVETFETSSRTNWTHAFTDGLYPFDFWHLSTAEPAPKTNAVVYITDRSSPTSYRMANDPTGTNTLANYSTGSVIQCYLLSPPVNASGVGTLFLAWREYFDTEPGWDFVEVHARSSADTNWVVVSPPCSGQTGGWTNRLADLSRFAGQAGVQVRFFFSAQNAINNHYRGWYVDDVRLYEGVSIDGWVRDVNGRPIVGAQVLAIGRGGVTNAFGGHRYIPPGKIFGSAYTADDGSYRITGLPRGRYYVKASEASHVDEFFNGPLFTPPYAFGSGLNPGVPDLDLVGAAGWVNLTGVGASGSCHFELERGSGRGYLGAMLPNPAGQQFEVLIDNVPVSIWNGLTGATAALVPYLTRTNAALANVYPDWETNAVAPTMLADVAPGIHQIFAGTNLALYPRAEVLVREGEVTRVLLSTNQGWGRLYVYAEDGGRYTVWVDGRDLGFTTPALVPLRQGCYQVALLPTNGTAWVAPRRVEVPLGGRATLAFSSAELTGNPGSLRVLTRDVNGNEVTGAEVYVDGRRLTAADVASGHSERTPTVADKLKPGAHFVTVTKDGYARAPVQAVAISQGHLSEVAFVLHEADADYDRVGDSLEIAGYTNIFLYSRSDDPDADGLSNLFEFELFRLYNIPLDIFTPDSDGDGMTDGEEVGYDGLPGRLALSALETNAVQGASTVRILFVGRYLDGVDSFGTAPVVASIEGDRFEAATVTHPLLPVPTRAPAVTVLAGIPASGRDRCVSGGHNSGSKVYADALPDRVDTDGDGMWDGFESLYGRTTPAQLDPIEYGFADQDPDFDGLSNYLEFLGPDGVPNLADISDPTRADSDGDGLPDGWEFTYGLRPTDPSDASEDPDGDGLSNSQEFSLRQTNPRLRDTDGDGLPDGAEVLQYGANPHVADTDGDGLSDGREVWDRDLNGVFDGGFFNFPSNHVAGDLDHDGFADGPMDWDTDGDGMPDGFEVLDAFGRARVTALNPFDPTDGDEDADGDGLSNLHEYLVRDALVGNHPSQFDPTFASAVWDYSTDPFNPDSDGDGMPDGWEVTLGLHPTDPVPTGSGTRYVRYEDLGAEGDLDGDGLFNLREFTVRFRLDPNADSNALVGASTDPWNPDTDSDGLADGEEDRSFRASPVLQDTDLDGLMDGADVPDNWGEIESRRRGPGGVPTVTNHFDRALNDLWRLVWPTVLDLPYWEKISVDPASPLPEPRWGMGAAYVPVFETKTVGNRRLILLDNRQLVILGGRDGVQRFTNIWEYVIRSNAWNLSAVSLHDIGLGEGLSELSAVTLLGYFDTKAPDCPCGAGQGQGYSCDGTTFGLPKSRPWDHGYPRSSFDWIYVLGGWDMEHRYYFASHQMPFFFYKSTDCPDPITEELIVASEGVNDRRLRPGDNALQPFGTLGATAVSQLVLTNLAEGINDTNAVNGLNPVGSGASNGFYFAPLALNPAQHVLLSATLRLPLTSTSPTTNQLSLVGELWLNGHSEPNYDSPTISQRLLGQYVSAPTNFTAVVNGFTPVEVDVTPIVQDMLAQPNWAQQSAGFILRGIGTGALIFLRATELRIAYGTPYGSYSRLGFFFSPTPLRTNCEEILKAELEFQLRSSGPSTNQMFVLGELWNAGTSDPDYDNPTLSNRLLYSQFLTAVYGFTATVDGASAAVADITPVLAELLAAPQWAASNLGFIVYGGAEGVPSYFVRGTTKLRVTYRPFYKVPPYWRQSTHLLVSSDLPSRRKSIVQVYDYDRDRLVAYGGLDGSVVFGDTFEGTPVWNDEYGNPVYANPEAIGNPRLIWWQKKSTAHSPGPRWGHSMVYDPVNRRVVLFGGFDADHRPLNDLWVYDGVDWTKKTDFTDSQRPPPRGGASMVFFGGYFYNRGRDAYCVECEKPRLVLFGGTDGVRYFNDTWVYDHVARRWILVNPVDEQSQGPSPRAFAAMVYAQNARLSPDPNGDSEYVELEGADRCATPAAYLFGGRTGTLPTSDDTDGDLVSDGLEYVLGGPGAGRDPRVNKLVEPDHPTETVPFGFLRIGSVPIPPTQRGTIANLEALNYSEGDTAGDYARWFNLPFQGYPLEDPTFSNTAFEAGVDAYLPQFTRLWYHRDGGEDPFGPGDIWELGVPDPTAIGTTACPPYAHSGRWCFGTVLAGRYPKGVRADLYSPLFNLTLPPDNATSSNFVGSFFLVFWEWLRLGDSNDVVWVQAVMPDSPAKVATRQEGTPGTGRATKNLLGPRNNAYNSAGTWRRVVVPLDPVANESNLYLRFRLESAATGPRDGGWYIDDVAILQAGSIAGILTNAGHSPLAGVRVELFGENGWRTPVSTTLTDNEGSFRFGFLPLGRYYFGAVSSVFGPFDLTEASPAASVGATNVGDLVLADIGWGFPTSITWPAVPGLSYQVEYADSLAGPWQVLGVVAASGSSATCLDYTAAGNVRFYRVRVLATP